MSVPHMGTRPSGRGSALDSRLRKIDEPHHGHDLKHAQDYDRL